MNQVNFYSSEDIISKIYESKKKKIRIYPQHVVRASEVGHPCERYLVYCITRWQDKLPHGPELEFIFEGGRLVENLAINDFEEAGFKVYRPEPDRAIAESKPRITGHIDIRVDFGNSIIHTGEIKGLNIYDWTSLNTIEDFYNSKKPWIKKYPAQLQTYLYIKAEEWGFFYLKSIPRFQPKFIWVKLDLNYMEEILQKTERIENHIANETLPDQIDDYDVCKWCPFLHICLPEIKSKILDIIENKELEKKLDRREEIKTIVSEYNLLDKEIKKAVEGKDKLLVGDWLITGKIIECKGDKANYWKHKFNKLPS